MKRDGAVPMRTLGIIRSSGEVFGTLTKFSQIKKAGEMAMIFDGVQAHDMNANRIATRHARGKQVNILFADGHVESFLPHYFDSFNSGLDPALL